MFPKKTFEIKVKIFKQTMIIAMRVSRLQTLDQHHLDTMARLAWPCSQVGATLSLTNREAALSHADDTA